MKLDRSLVANKTLANENQIRRKPTILTSREKIETSIGGLPKSTVKVMPRPTARINLMWLDCAIVLQVFSIIANKLSDNRCNVTVSPIEPILNSRLQIAMPPAIRFSRIHFGDLISVLLIVRTTVNHADDNRIRVKRMPSDLSRIGQLHERLTHIGVTAIQFIDKQDARLIASLQKPTHRSESCLATPRRILGLWNTDHISGIRHLRSATLNNGKDIIVPPFSFEIIAKNISELIRKLIGESRLADTMGTVPHDRLARANNDRRDAVELLE